MGGGRGVGDGRWARGRVGWWWAVGGRAKPGAEPAHVLQRRLRDHVVHARGERQSDVVGRSRLCRKRKRRAQPSAIWLLPAPEACLRPSRPVIWVGCPSAARDALAGHIGLVFHIAWDIRFKRLTVAQSSRPDFSGGERLALLKEPRRPADAVRQVRHAPRELTRRHHLSRWHQTACSLLRPGAPDRVRGDVNT